MFWGKVKEIIVFRFIPLITVFIVLAMVTISAATEPKTVVCKKNMSWNEWEIKFAPAVNMIPKLSVENRLKILQGFNFTKPITDFNPEKVFLISAPDYLFPPQTQVLVFFVNNNCVTSSTPVPTEVVNKWLVGIKSAINIKV